MAKLPVRLGRCYVELHYGTVLWILSRLILAVTKLGGKLRTVRPAKRSHGAIRSQIPLYGYLIITYVQNTPWKVRAYGNYARVADVSVIRRVSGHLH